MARTLRESPVHRRGLWLRGVILVVGLTMIPWFILQAQLRPTPHTGEGPFYPVDDSLPADADLTTVPDAEGEPDGQPLTIQGTVRNTDGQAVSGARLVIWQTDIHGKYDHPAEQRTTGSGVPLPKDPNFQYWGKTLTDAEGRYSFRTIVPGSYGRRPAHIHFRITHPGYETLASEMQFRGDPHAAEDFVTGETERERLAVRLESSESHGAARASFDIVLAR